MDHLVTGDGIPVPTEAPDSPLFAAPKSVIGGKSRIAGLSAVGLLVQTVRHAFGVGTSTCTSPVCAAATASATATATATGTGTNTGLATITASGAALLAALSARLQTTTASFIATVRHSPRAAIKPILTAALLLYVLRAAREFVLTYGRQKIDATSEWGRYADDPAARGRALMILCVRIAPYVVASQVLKLLPGGKSKKEGGGDDAKKANGVNGTVNGEINNEGEPTMWAQRQSASLQTKSGSLFADGLLRLGPLYIKMGQILSCREKLLPDEWIGSMAKLQDRVPAKSGQDALDLVYAAMPGGKSEFDATFADFDDVPLAAASLGQVHRARLRSTGEPVAIKVQRARLRDIYDKDLALMHKIASGVDKLSDLMGGRGNVGGVEQSWSQIFTDAEVILYREIDYRDEADNAARFATDFGLGLGGKAITSTALSIDGKPLPSAAEWMRTPYTYKELSSENILVMEFVPSIKVTDEQTLNAAGVTREDKEFLAESLARSYLRQFCANRFFSTDPHPGNLGVEVVEEGEKFPRMVFYDFGQACSLADDQAGGILDVIEGITDMDAKACVTAFDRMGVLKDGADLKKVQAKVQNNFDTGKISVKEAKQKQQAKMKARKAPRSKAKRKVEHDKLIAESTQVINGSNATTVANAKGEISLPNETTSTKPQSGDKPPGDAEVMEYFTLPAEYAFVARAISQLDGVGKALDPEFDFISASAPHIVEVKGAEKYLADETKKTLVGFEKKGAEFQAKILETFGWDASKFLKKD